MCIVKNYREGKRESKRDGRMQKAILRRKRDRETKKKAPISMAQVWRQGASLPLPLHLDLSKLPPSLSLSLSLALSLSLSRSHSLSFIICSVVLFSLLCLPLSIFFNCSSFLFSFCLVSISLCISSYFLTHSLTPSLTLYPSPLSLFSFSVQFSSFRSHPTSVRFILYSLLLLLSLHTFSLIILTDWFLKTKHPKVEFNNRVGRGVGVKFTFGWVTSSELLEP